MSNIIAINEQNIRTAISDYRRHTSEVTVLDDISDDFIHRLAVDSANSKFALRNLFSKSPAWNEDLQAIVINGSRTHNPDFDKLENIAFKILKPLDKDSALCQKIIQAIHFFPNPDEDCEDYIQAINAIAPKAYRKGKKKSRIFKAICDSLGVSNDAAGSEFQRLFAQFADELSARKIDFKLFVSINPAHFLTMSNPKHDERGSTMVSCHSINSTEYSYNCGCSGYARDNYSFIVFTASDPANPETLNNRKTSRQIFSYKPNNGLLLQSRMCTTNSGGSYGGINGDTEEGKLYRDLIQREISALENVPNLWITRDYYQNEFDATIRRGYGFGGYADWLEYTDCAKISIRKDKIDSFENFEIGTHGICISCADLIYSGLYCDSCQNTNRYICDDCENYCDELTQVHDFNGDVISVCNNCLDEYYRYCQHCNQYFHIENMNDVGDFCYVCHDCLDRYYTICADCDEYFLNEDTYTAVDRNGNEIDVCCNCLEHYIECYECGRYVHQRNTIGAFSSNGELIHICPDCRNYCYEECEICGELLHQDNLADGLCAACTKKEGESA